MDSTASSNDRKEKKIGLSISRVKKIMKCSGEVDCISKDGTIIMARATEMFIALLATNALKKSIINGKLSYKDVANVVHTNEKYSFLTEMIPKKIIVKEYFKILKKIEKKEQGHNDSVKAATGKDLKRQP